MKYIIIIFFLFQSIFSFSDNVKKIIGHKYTKWAVLTKINNPNEIYLFNNIEDFSYYSEDLKSKYGVEHLFNEVWALNNKFFLYRKKSDSSNYYRSKFLGDKIKNIVLIKKINHKNYIIVFAENEIIGIYEYINAINYFDEFNPKIKMKIIKLKVILKSNWLI